MIVTLRDLENAGANMSNGYLYHLTCPTGTTVKHGFYANEWDTERIKKAIYARRYAQEGNPHISNGQRARSFRCTQSILKAISKLEKKIEVIRISV